MNYEKEILAAQIKRDNVSKELIELKKNGSKGIESKKLELWAAIQECIGIVEKYAK